MRTKLKSDLPDYLPHLINDTFDQTGERTQSVQERMAYQFKPDRKVVQFNGLSLEAVLNHDRLSYVRSTMELTRQSRQTELDLGDDRTKRSLRPHMPPPGSDVCQFCDLKQKSPLFIGRLLLRDKDYGLIVNPRPWGYRNFMLVTKDPEPQAMNRENLTNSFELIKTLGSDYEAIFTGVQAGASVYHFHLQIHRGSAAIWKNLVNRKIQLKPFFTSAGVTASYVEGWPAGVFAFEGSDIESLAAVVSCMIETFAGGDNDFPYNIGFRYQHDVIRLLLFPRTGEEQPPCMEDYPDSWGRFGFLELGGSVYILTPEAYEAISESGPALHDAIARMSINPSEYMKLITDFQSLTSHRI
jgi:hypothetical protein